MIVYLNMDSDRNESDNLIADSPKSLGEMPVTRRGFLRVLSLFGAYVVGMNYAIPLASGLLSDKGLTKERTIYDQNLRRHLLETQNKTGIQFYISNDLKPLPKTTYDERLGATFSCFSSVPRSVLEDVGIGSVLIDRREEDSRLNGSAWEYDVPLKVDLHIRLTSDDQLNRNTVFHEICHRLFRMSPVTERGILGVISSRSIFLDSEIENWQRLSDLADGYQNEMTPKWDDDKRVKGFGQSMSLLKLLDITRMEKRYGVQDINEDAASVGGWVLESIDEELNIFHILQESPFFAEDSILQQKVRIFCDVYYRRLKECKPSELEPIHKKFFANYEADKLLSQKSSRRNLWTLRVGGVRR